MPSSIKLCITVQANLAAKYSASALARIDKALQAWIKADAARGITTLHLPLDDAAAMKGHDVAAITGRATPVKVKRALDALCRKLQPEYVVILGGDEVVPMFRVPNPSHDPNGDTDRDVPTDNPYACSTAYSAKNRNSYLVPDRVLGRINDLPGSGDANWLVGYLKRATAWKPRARSHYDAAYAVCCDEWQGAGEACMQYLGLPAGDLMISPPTVDATAPARNRLARELHMIKCHGAELDARFYGQKGNDFPAVLDSATLKPRLRPGTLAAAMCCYGAQVYAPGDPAAQPANQWSIAATYLRQGAVGFAGATKIAWVGVQQMACADWIVCSYLKGALNGASLGRALLEAKQDYVKWLASQGWPTDQADEKTLIEFVLLGDPSLHPVMAPAVPAMKAVAAAARRVGAPPVSPLQVQERRQRRELRIEMASQIRRALPARHEAAAPRPDEAKALFSAVQSMFGKSALNLLDPGYAHAEKLVRPPRPAPAAAAAATAAARPTAARAAASASASAAAGESIEYYWTGRKVVKGQARIQLLKVETDTQGTIVRTRLLHSS